MSDLPFRQAMQPHVLWLVWSSHAIWAAMAFAIDLLDRTALLVVVIGISRIDPR